MANPDADKHVRNVTKSLVCPGSALEPRTIVEQKSMHPHFCRGAHEEKTSLLKSLCRRGFAFPSSPPYIKNSLVSKLFNVGS